MKRYFNVEIQSGIFADGIHNDFELVEVREYCACEDETKIP